MQRGPPSVVPLVRIRILLRQPIHDIFDIPVNDRLTQACGVADVGHIRPVLLCQRVEGPNLLASRVINKEGDLAGDIYLGLFLCYLLFLIGLRHRAISTAVFNNILDAPEKRRMAMKINCSIFRLVPLCIQQQIFREGQFLNAFGVEFLPVRYGEGVVVADVLLRQPISHFILMILFDIAMKTKMIAVDLWPSSLLAALVEVIISSRAGWQPLEDQQPSQTKCALEAPLENRRINPRSVEFWPVNLKVAMRVFRETVLVGWRSAAEINVVDLGDEAAKGTRRNIDLLAIIGTASSVDVEASQNFADGLVNAQNDLQGCQVWSLSQSYS